jgi:hypothetical protein
MARGDVRVGLKMSNQRSFQCVKVQVTVVRAQCGGVMVRGDAGTNRAWKLKVLLKELLEVLTGPESWYMEW